MPGMAFGAGPYRCTGVAGSLSEGRGHPVGPKPQLRYDGGELVLRQQHPIPVRLVFRPRPVCDADVPRRNFCLPSPPGSVMFPAFVPSGESLLRGAMRSQSSDSCSLSPPGSGS